jgi:hypothetical protein
VILTPIFGTSEFASSATLRNVASCSTDAYI